jgi:hypothetical protein
MLGSSEEQEGQHGPEHDRTGGMTRRARRGRRSCAAAVWTALWHCASVELAACCCCEGDEAIGQERWLLPACASKRDLLCVVYVRCLV